MYPWATVRSMIFQHDGAPPRHATEVKNFLNQTHSRWIGRDGEARWPPKVPGPRASRFSSTGACQRTSLQRQHFQRYTLEANDCGGVRETEKRHRLAFCSDIVDSSSKLVYAATRGTFSTILVTAYRVVVLRQKVVTRNRELIISRDTLYCFNHAINNVCKHCLERRQPRWKNRQLNRSQG